MSRNERLLEAIKRAGLTPAGLAQTLDVDPKTVERWVTLSRMPYPRHRDQLAEILGEAESWLWPEAVTAERIDAASQSEVIRVFAHRSQIPAQLWTRLFDRAMLQLDILVYAGLFLPEQTPGLSELLSRRAASGTAVRLLLGDPDCEAVRVRGLEEGIGDAVNIKIRNALHLYRSLENTEVHVRLHTSTLYTSLYRFDEEMIANPHILGLPAAQSPALHLRRLSAEDLFDTYGNSFERTWSGAHPAWNETG